MKQGSSKICRKESRKQQYDRFKSEVLACIDRLRIGGTWDVRFEDRPNLKSAAKVMTCTKNRVATFAFGHLDDDYTTALLARHEVAHLLIAELSYLANSRYVTEAEVDQAGEEICTVLEKML